MSAKPAAAGALLEVLDLKVHFPVRKRFKTSLVKAVDGVSFSVNRGETVGLVGESGCGKTTIGRTILRFYEPTGGAIRYDGADISHCDMTPYRRRLQIVFQDPYSSLDPRMSVGEIVGEPLRLQYPRMPRVERDALVLEQLVRVGLTSEHMSRFPHEFSGGQRQRVSIARAMVIQPELLVCDEPISALDVSIQAQIINMLMDLQDRTGITYLFIAHDLSVVRHISRRIVVMYLGHVMETNTSADLYRSPRHPYTRALLSSIPVPDPNTSRAQKRVVLQGEVPSPVNPPPGCVFSTRCPLATEVCRTTVPSMSDLGAGHAAACHHLDS
jgi:oligopeptide transport system ATP-binding protein